MVAEREALAAMLVLWTNVARRAEAREVTLMAH
jgi:hypothetical protein